MLHHQHELPGADWLLLTASRLRARPTQGLPILVTLLLSDAGFPQNLLILSFTKSWRWCQDNVCSPGPTRAASVLHASEAACVACCFLIQAAAPVVCRAGRIPFYPARPAACLVMTLRWAV